MAETAAPRFLQSRRTRLALLRTLLVVVSTVVSLLMAEWLCRALIAPQESIRFQQDADELDGMRLHEAVRMIENDPELFWKLLPDTRLAEENWPFFGVISNSQSLREDHEIPFAKPMGQTRILFLGDSCTFGYGVAHDAAFVEVTESLLKQQGRDVECINAGVPGYTLFQGCRYLETQGLNYQPDLVVFNFGWNDTGMWDQFGDREHHDLLRAMQPPGLLRHSRICQLVWGHLKKPKPRQGEKRPRLLPGEFAETLEQAHALLAHRDIPMLVLLWPMRENSDPNTPADARNPWQLEMIRFGSSHPLSVDPPVAGLLDLVPVGRQLIQQFGEQAIYYDHGHVTPAGHRAIAQALVGHLGPWLGR